MSETATHYNYFRDYDPAIGRYVQSDPIGLRAGISTYAYVMSGPLTGSDKLGLWAYWGNWCGPNWTGRRVETFNPGHSYQPPIDLLDMGCMRHDRCYFQCREGFPCDKPRRGECMTRCDRTLAHDALKTGLGRSIGIVPSGLGLYLWMGTNIWPDPGDDSPNCQNCPTAGAK